MMDPEEQKAQQQKRMLLVVAVLMLGMVAYSFFGPKGTPPAPPPAEAPQAQQVQGADVGTGAPVEPATPGSEAAAAAAIATEKVEFTTPAQKLVFSNDGAGLIQATALDGGVWPARKFQARGKEKNELFPIELVQNHAGSLPVGASEVTGGAMLPAKTRFQVERQGDRVVQFKAQTLELELTKRFETNPNGYDLKADYTVTNRGTTPLPLRLRILYPSYVEPGTQQSGGIFSMLKARAPLSQAACRRDHSNKLIHLDPEKEVREGLAGPVQYMGYDERYFMGVIFPRDQTGTRCELLARQNGEMESSLEVDLGTVAPGQSVTRQFGIYLGPKYLDELNRVSDATTLGAGLAPLGQAPVATTGAIVGADPQLKESVEYGWFAVIARLLLWVMKFFQKLVTNWGVAIILLTLLVKAILFPLSHKQMESMEGMRTLQPKIEALKKKHGSDREKLNLEQMKLYQEHKINPLGGCAPMLIQMPVWFALYQTLQGSFELYREPFLPFWLNDLTAMDPLYILPIVMGISMFLTQKMQPQMGDATQAKMMLYLMPVMFTFMTFQLPAGLTLYIFTNNVLSIAQQQYFKRKFAKKRAAAAAA